MLPQSLKHGMSLYVTVNVMDIRMDASADNLTEALTSTPLSNSR